MKELRDSLKKFTEADTVVLGISTDSAESHKKFCSDLELPFDLLADTDGKLHKAYGFKGMVRALVLIDKKGEIRYVNRKFNLSKEHWDELFKEVEALKDKK